MTSFAWGSATDIGRVRGANQDRFVAEAPVFVVADGMGGHHGGEIASDIAANELAQATDIATIDDLIGRVQEANAGIVERARQQPELRGMGTTVTVLADIRTVGPNRLGLANVGDSRLYRVEGDGLFQHTEDHSLVEALVRDGRLTRSEAAVHPQRNIVTRALGIDERVLVDAWELVPVVGDRYLLCSDGLFGEVEETQIHEVLSTTESPQEAAEDLVRRACDAGGRDNVTVVVVDVVDADSTADVPPDRVADVRKALPDGVLKVEKQSAADHAAEMASLVDPDPDEVRGEVVPSVMTWRVGAFVVAVLAVVIGMLVVVLVIGRSGFSVVEGDDGRVVILQGQDDGFLWLDPTVEVESEIEVVELPPAERAQVEEGQDFDTRSEAETYLDYLATQVDPTGS